MKRAGGRKNRWLSAVFLSLALALIGTVPGQAERVVLDNGRILEGLITAEDEEHIQLQMKFGIITLKRSEINEIKATDPGEFHVEAGQDFFERGLLEKAESHFRKASKYETTAATAERLLKAVADSRRSGAEDLIHLEVYRARQMAAAGGIEEAIAHLETSRQERGDHEAFRELLTKLRPKLAWEYIDHLQYSRAMEQILLARDDGADRATLRYLVGLVSHYQGQELAAQYEIAAALEERPEIQMEFPAPRAKPVNREDSEATLVVSWSRPRPRKRTELLRTVRNLHADRAANLPTHVPQDMRSAIEKASVEYRVPQELIVAVIEAESSFNPKAVSPAGAQGLMQLMPGTARDMGVKDAFDPEENIRGGTRYLSLMMTSFDRNMNHALAAYNAGPATVKFHKGIPPYPETQTYVSKVLARYEQLVVSSREG